ncbi:MAG: pyruvate, phosphate dikinase [Chlorobium sp.]|uniref:pyruvate, phosphate dikinase n=1 Tax=Chlorobium sp. TaxID=1095 RepID=UPI0025C0EF10|nr:pyruvate, phosphate dikinase [Chlorobium sp.]MCF8217279.1 pyruvate, phosphate dikinase [Chlorobium sp.]MCF8272164.1 pyruvate, phosphate dikinase [Chlorobium sp.]MCF8288474.1 pyruvate, phosphate dikinase [Chlorobium sp.]MCF8292129.1 pyruvate, phosphate dikinase [Chlorobium sp.]MCF8386190.1 pyruvate, phosphate dikinase [Chlorobium sp.]
MFEPESTKTSPGEKRYIYSFAGGCADGDASMKNLLGGKGANLAEMAIIGLPVPPGFTISTAVCTWFYDHQKTFPENLFERDIPKALGNIEGVLGKRFGDPENPLLLSVRSGARTSMPGMMDTILNLGLNTDTVEGLARKSGNPRFAWDCYRRFVQMYGDVVLDLKPSDKKQIDPFEAILEAKKHELGIKLDTGFSVEDLKDLVSRYKVAILEKTGRTFPEDPCEQLLGAIGAVFNSWNNERAIVYRRLNHIPDYWGTACNIQAMVFGNMGSDSGTGVAFTRDAANGDNIFYGEFLMNAQGEDVVAGIRTPLKIEQLKQDNPKIYAQLDDIRSILEKHYRDMMDIEFTIESNRLFMLQCRVGKRTGMAAIKIAVDMVKEGLIDENEAIMRIEPEQLNQLLRPVFDLKEKQVAIGEGRLLATGLNAGPGAATGRICFNAADAADVFKQGEAVILVRIETSPEDIRGMAVSEGVLTERGGMTSHAALVARQMGKVCVVGCGALSIDYQKGELRVEGNDLVLRDGDYLSIDGTTGEVIAGKVPTRNPEIIEVLIDKTLKPEDAPIWALYNQLMEWADRCRKLSIRTNADQPDQAENAISFGAEGIGLCRTEHMFFGGDKIDAMREMILADDIEGRKAALDKLLPVQREDFYGLFKAMGSRPVTIRLLDPPLHEFLPHTVSEIEALAGKIGKSVEAVTARIDDLHECNPMLGLRGCRLGILHPEIPAMQVRAIIEAACRMKHEGHEVVPEIMVPLVSTVKELEVTSEIIHKTARDVIAAQGIDIRYLVGTMIEVPRAALTSAAIARAADFFSYGTNDLTQMGLGMSRDDSGQFLPAYQQQEIFDCSPFESIDIDGVGRMLDISVQEGRSVKPDLKLGICGEQGGDPATIEFCHKTGLNYVSCSPFRVPIARLAAARAALQC